MLNEDWKTKAERLWRSFAEFRQVVEDADAIDRIAASDALVQFCREAFELRDWLSHSCIDQSAKHAVRRLFGTPRDNPAKRVAPTSVALAACADIANESKHLELARPSYSAGGYAKITSEEMSSISDLPEFVRDLVDDDVPPGFGDHQWKWIITIDDVEHDALLLAEDAMKDWGNCLASLELVTSELYGWSYPAA